MDSSMVKLCENVFEISCLAVYLQQDDLIFYDDSRDLFQEILWIAKSFEQEWNHNENSDVDYIESIQAYAKAKLMEAFKTEM